MFISRLTPLGSFPQATIVLACVVYTHRRLPVAWMGPDLSVTWMGPDLSVTWMGPGLLVARSVSGLHRARTVSGSVA